MLGLCRPSGPVNSAPPPLPQCGPSSSLTTCYSPRQVQHTPDLSAWLFPPPPGSSLPFQIWPCLPLEPLLLSLPHSPSCSHRGRDMLPSSSAPSSPPPGQNPALVQGHPAPGSPGVSEVAPAPGLAPGHSQPIPAPQPLCQFRPQDNARWHQPLSRGRVHPEGTWGLGGPSWGLYFISCASSHIQGQL